MVGAYLLGSGVLLLAGLLLSNGLWWVINHPHGGFLKPLWRWTRKRFSRQRRLELERAKRNQVYEEWVEATRVRVEHKMLQRKQDRSGWQREWETVLPRDTYPFTVQHTAVNNRINYKHIRVPAEDPVYTMYDPEDVSLPAKIERAQDYLERAVQRLEHYKELHDLSESEEEAKQRLMKVRGY